MATITRYEIRTGPEHHSGRRPWMRLASTVAVDAKTVGARCSYVAQTNNPAALEAALEADDDVIEYRVATNHESPSRSTSGHAVASFKHISSQRTPASPGEDMPTKAEMEAEIARIRNTNRNDDPERKILMTYMLRNHRQKFQRGLVDLLEDGRVLWHDTPNEVRWWHGDFLTPAPRMQR